MKKMRASAACLALLNFHVVHLYSSVVLMLFWVKITPPEPVSLISTYYASCVQISVLARARSPRNKTSGYL